MGILELTLRNWLLFETKFDIEKKINMVEQIFNFQETEYLLFRLMLNTTVYTLYEHKK